MVEFTYKLNIKEYKMSNTNQHGISIGIKRVDSFFFLKMKLIGKLTHEDYKTIIPMIEKSLHSVDDPNVSLLVDATQFEGWSLEAAFDDLKIGLNHNSDFKKIAFVGNKSWQEYSIKLTNWFMSGQMEYFEDINEAINWLNTKVEIEQENEDLSMTEKEIYEREEAIEKQLELLFKANMKITNWDVPETDDRKAAEMIIDILEKKVTKLKEDVKKGKYNYY